MKLFILATSIFFATSLFSQNKADTRILIKIKDTSNTYEKVKYALVNEEFIVKDNGRRDTLTTYAHGFNALFCIVQAALFRDSVVIRGWYGVKRLDDFTVTSGPSNYKPVLYFGGRGDMWKHLMNVAKRIGDEINYAP